MKICLSVKQGPGNSLKFECTIETWQTPDFTRENTNVSDVAVEFGCSIDFP